MDKVQNIITKKKRLIGVIIFAAIVIISLVAIALITNAKKVISTESDPRIGEASTNADDTKTACGIKIKFFYDDKYWEKYDLTNAVYKTQDEYETAVCNYIDEIATLLNKQDWYEQNKGKDTLYIDLVIAGKERYGATKQYLEDYDDTMPISSYTERLADYTPKANVYTMNFNSAMFDHNIVPIVHQLTNLITYNKVDKRSSFSSYLNIGFGEYVQNYLGMGNSSCNHGLDIHNYVIEHEKIYENDPTISASIKAKGLFRRGLTGGIPVGSSGGTPVAPSEGSTVRSSEGSTVRSSEGSTVRSSEGSTVRSSEGSTVTSSQGSIVITSSGGSTVTLPNGVAVTIPNGVTVTSSETLPNSVTVTSSGGAAVMLTPSVDSKNFSIECCSSFVDYLVRTYGLANVVKMVGGYDDSIYYLFNQNGLDGLISDWQQFLANYHCKMTWDEINAFITEFKSTHGY